MDNRKSKIMNILVLGLAIVIVCVTKTRFRELFVARVPITGLGDHRYPYHGSPQAPPPYMYQQQYYPQAPYYGQVGKPCGPNGCGSMGECVNTEGQPISQGVGVCRAIPYNKTAFNSVIG